MPFKRIALLMERHPGYQEDVLRGVRQYADGSRNWLCQAAPATEGAIRDLATWQPDGVIAGVHAEYLIDLLLGLGKPAVDVFDWFDDAQLPRVAIESTEIGRMAAAHLLDRGYRSFGFVRGHSPLRFLTDREAGFASVLREAGFDYATYVRPSDEVDFTPLLWAGGSASMQAWVRQLPKPVGVYAATDAWGQRLIDSCRGAAVAVPDQVAIIGTDDDELLCTLAQPPLSSIAIDASRVGYEAAAMLDRLMDGRQPAAPPPQVKLRPVGAVTRRSTDALAVDDPDVAEALRLVRSEAGRAMSVSQILARLPVHRRTLERKVRRTIGRGLAEEMRRVKVDRARQVLATTDLPMPDVARRAGFSSAMRLSIVFQQDVGTTPTAYRQNFRSG
jgi:LacI family transcriptional regulator